MPWLPTWRLAGTLAATCDAKRALQHAPTKCACSAMACSCAHLLSSLLRTHCVERARSTNRCGWERTRVSRCSRRSCRRSLASLPLRKSSCSRSCFRTPTSFATPSRCRAFLCTRAGTRTQQDAHRRVHRDGCRYSKAAMLPGDMRTHTCVSAWQGRERGPDRLANAALLAMLLCARRQVVLVRQRLHVDAKGAVTFSQQLTPCSSSQVGAKVMLLGKSDPRLIVSTPPTIGLFICCFMCLFISLFISLFTELRIGLFIGLFTGFSL
jgi:hypothetical protein